MKQYSIIGVLALTTLIAIEFRSGVMLNIGISISVIAAIGAGASVYSLYPQRASLMPSELAVLEVCLAVLVCSSINLLVIAAILVTIGVPDSFHPRIVTAISDICLL